MSIAEVKKQAETKMHKSIDTLKADLAKVAAALEPAGKVAKGAAGYVLDGRWNDSFRAVNLLLLVGASEL